MLSFFGGNKGKVGSDEDFQKLQKDMGMDVVMEAFWKVLAAVEEDMFHDPLGCSECCV